MYIAKKAFCYTENTRWCPREHQGTVTRSNVYYSEEWEWFGMTTVGEKVKIFIAGKWWPLSALKRVLNKLGEKWTLFGQSSTFWWCRAWAGKNDFLIKLTLFKIYYRFCRMLVQNVHSGVKFLYCSLILLPNCKLECPPPFPLSPMFCVYVYRMMV